MEIKGGAIVRNSAFVNQGFKRRRITETEAKDWARKARDGMRPSQIADKAGVQLRTVITHLSRLEDARTAAGVQHELLLAAAQKHQRDLMSTAVRLGAALVPHHLPLDRPPGGKLVEALVSHSRGSGVPHGVRQWEALATRYQAVDLRLKTRCAGAIEAEGFLPDGTAARLQIETYDYIRNALPRVPLYAAKDGLLWEGATPFLDGVESIDDHRAKAGCRRFEDLKAELAGWVEVADLTKLYRRFEALRVTLSDELENLVLRGWFWGSCTLCPSRPARSPRTPRRRPTEPSV